jgi:hypothetical protein
MGHDGYIQTVDAPGSVVRSQIDTKHEIRADSCSRGNLLLAQPPKVLLVKKEARI